MKQIKAQSYNMHLKLIHNKHELLPKPSHEIMHKNAPQLHFHHIASKTLLHALQNLTLQQSGKEIRNDTLIIPIYS